MRSKEVKDQWTRMVDEQMLELAACGYGAWCGAGADSRETHTRLAQPFRKPRRRRLRFSTYMGAQNSKLRALKLGSFGELAYAMLVDAAMLSWLDGAENVATSPNENLSREFMELFALGHGQRLQRRRCERRAPER